MIVVEFGVAMSDRALVERTRAGDARALGELWKRHYRSGVRVARQYTSVAVDDVVAEAFITCYERRLAGRGLDGAFRPLFYASIREVASSRLGTQADATTDALSRTLTARAFQSLPGEWRAVLWYLEVEGMDPHEAAPIVGMTANAVADVLYRARVGMRSAWLAGYAADAAARGMRECEWTAAHLDMFTSHGLTSSDSDRVAVHLVACHRCSMLNRQEVDIVTRLALVMIPLVLGPHVGGRYLGLFGTARALPAARDEVPPMPQLTQPLAS